MRGADVREWREARGLNRRRLSALLDVAESTVARWENEERAMPSKLVELALRGLEVERGEWVRVEHGERQS
jgi:transcriptional regulator with XRE-family HTH domain